MPYRNKEKQKEYARKHYLKNKEKMIERSKIRNKRDIERNRKYVDEYLSTHPCVDCGESDLIVLEFDHVRGEKLDNVSNLVLSYRSLEVIQNEINKCEIRCANCHRRITHKRRVQSLQCQP